MIPALSTDMFYLNTWSKHCLLHLIRNWEFIMCFAHCSNRQCAPLWLEWKWGWYLCNVRIVLLKQNYAIFLLRLPQISFRKCLNRMIFWWENDVLIKGQNDEIHVWYMSDIIQFFISKNPWKMCEGYCLQTYGSLILLWSTQKWTIWAFIFNSLKLFHGLKTSEFQLNSFVVCLWRIPCICITEDSI